MMNFYYSELILAACVVVFTVVHFLVNYRYRNKILLSDVFIWFAGALFGGGPFLSLAFGYRDFPEFSMPLLYTYLSVVLFFLGLLLSKLLFQNTLIRHPKLTKGGQRSPVFYFIDHCREIPITNLIGVFLVFIGIKAYNISIGGGISGFNTLDVMMNKSYVVVVLEQITDPFKYVLLFCCFFSLFKGQKRSWIFVIPILFALLTDSFLQGRREMVYFVVVAGFTLFAVKRRIKFSYAVMVVGAVIIIFGVISPFYLAFRSAGQEARNTEVDNRLISLMSRGLEEAQLRSGEQLAEKGTNNLAHRFLLIRTVPYTLFEVQEEQLPMFGKAFFQAATSALPRSFRPYEAWINPESYVQMQFGLPIRDESTSVLGHFVADFWLLGGLIGGLFLGLYLNFGTYLAFRIFQSMPVVGISVFASLFTLAINTEINPGFILVVPRNLFVMWIIFLCVRFVGIKVKDVGGLPPPERSISFVHPRHKGWRS